MPLFIEMTVSRPVNRRLRGYAAQELCQQRRYTAEVGIDADGLPVDFLRAIASPRWTQA